MNARRAFSLMEVLIALALFGLSCAAMLSTVVPLMGELGDVSDTQKDAGELEMVKFIVEDRQGYAAGNRDGVMPLPDGGSLGWTANATPSATEALFLVRLSITRPDGSSREYEYLHFDPTWHRTEREAPRWLPHSFFDSKENSPPGGGPPATGPQGSRPPNETRGPDSGDSPARPTPAGRRASPRLGTEEKRKPSGS